MKEHKSRKRYLPMLSGTLLSGLGTMMSACCIGVGSIACGAVCAPSCGALSFSLLGLSSSAIANWANELWWIFLLLSSFAFLEAYVRIFKIKDVSSSSQKTKIIFWISLCLTSLVYAYSFFR